MVKYYRFFNGDDAIALYKVSSTSFVDIFGNIGCDPGSAWTDVNTTVNKTLVRNPSIVDGISTDDATSCPFLTLASEWTQFNQDDVSNLGSHTMTCAATPTLTVVPSTLTGFTYVFGSGPSTGSEIAFPFCAVLWWSGWSPFFQ